MKKYVYTIMLLILVMLPTLTIAEELLELSTQTITYEINHKKYKSSEGIIEKEGKLYVEISELARLLGLYAKYENQTIILNTEEAHVTMEKLYFEEATISYVDKEAHQLTISPKSEEVEESIKIVVGKDTRIECSLLARIFPFDILKEGMKVSVTCFTENMQTLPCYRADTIEILADDVLLEGLLPVIENASIIEINEVKQYMIIETHKNGATQTDETILIYIDYNTNIKDQQGNNHYQLADLKKGQRITIITNGIMTHSKPAQTVGLEIIILE